MTVLGVVGAGTMGAGIAQLGAAAGIERFRGRPGEVERAVELAAPVEQASAHQIRLGACARRLRPRQGPLEQVEPVVALLEPGQSEQGGDAARIERQRLAERGLGGLRAAEQVFEMGKGDSDQRIAG